MNNIIEIKASREPVTVAPPRWQYDYGQVVQFVGIDLPVEYEVQFSNGPRAEAVTVIGDADGAAVPDALMATGKPVYCWLVLHDGEDDGRVMAAAVIPVSRRGAVSDQAPTPEEQSAISTAIAALQAHALESEGWAKGQQGGVDVEEGSPYYHDSAKYWAGQAEDQAEAAEDSAEAAAGSEEGAEDAAEAAAGSATAAAGSATAAAGSASDAATSATAAATSAGAAAGSAAAAAGSATSAGSSATAAANSESNANSYKDLAMGYAAAASGYATQALGARDDILGMTAQATGLPAGSDPTASYSEGVLSLGIPKGDKGDTGDTGATPEISIGTVNTGDAGTDAAVTVGGTAEEPVLNFTIPKGAKGDAGNGDMLAPAFAEVTANAAGSYVTYDGGLYYLPSGHTANATWANTSKTAVTVGGDLSDLKSAISAMDTATTGAIDKALSPKTVTNGHVTEWQFKSISGGSGADVNYVTPEEYGAVGDGVTDDTDAIATAIATGEKVFFANKTYLINPITINSSAELVGENGAKIITPQHTSALTFLPAIKARLAMAEDYDHLDYTADSGASRITLTSIGNVTVGDLVYIYATNQNYIPARSYYYKGCTALVTKVDSENSCIYINFAMPFDMEATGTVVDVYEPVNVRINNIDFESSLNLEATTGSAGVRISYGAFCDICNCNFSGFTHQVLLYNCVMTNIEDCSFANAKPDNALHWDGYGIMLASCNVTNIKRVTANCGQHAVSTGGNTPVYGTSIQDCRLLSECGNYAIGLHDNDHDCVVERSVIGGMWGCGNLTVRNVRMILNAHGSAVLLTGNPDNTRTNVLFDNVDFGTMYIDISAYPQDAVEAYDNDFGNVIFENCTGGYFRIIDLTSKSLISGSNIKLIYVNHWQECNGFTLSYGTISELNLNSLIFTLKVVNGYITSQTKRVINRPCIVLTELDGDETHRNNLEINTKASAIYKNSGTLYTASGITDSGNGKIRNLKIYGTGTDIDELKSVTLGLESGNIFPELDGFEINIENTHINGVSGYRNIRRTLIPATWKRKTFQISCMIDNTNGNYETQCVDVHLYNSNGNEIYRGPLAGSKEFSVFESKFNFVVPDEAYSMIVNARIYADGEGKTVRAYDFKLKMKQSLNVTCSNYSYVIPAMTIPTYINGNGDALVANYYDLERGMFVRELEWFRTDVIPNDALTSWNDYFDSSIVGGFIPAEIVGNPSGIGRNLSDYYSETTTILDTDTPPTDEPCVWIHDGGIGFAYYVADVGERTMSALLTYIKSQTYNIMCREYAPLYENIDMTQIMIYNELVTYETGTAFTIDDGLAFSLDYAEQIPVYVNEKLIEYDRRPFRLIKTVNISNAPQTILVSTDESGNSFELTDVIIDLDMKAASGAGTGVIIPNISAKPNSSTESALPGLCFTFFGTSELRKVAHVWCEGGRFFGESVYNSMSTYYSPQYKQVSLNATGIKECATINSLLLYSINSYTFGNDSVIKVYGR